jgi:predicted PurR-regulated permease PerM
MFDPQQSAGGVQEIKPAPKGSWLWVVTAGAAVLVLGAGFLASFWFFLRPLAMLFMGVALAGALAPVAAWLARFLPRKLAAVLLFVVIVLIMAGLGLLIMPRLVDQANELVERVPGYVEDIESWVERKIRLQNGLPYDQILSSFSGFAEELAYLPIKITTSIFDGLLVIVISLYALLTAPMTRKTFLSLLPVPRRPEAEQTIREVLDAMGGYFRGALVTGLIVGTITYFGLLLLGMDFPLILAILAGFAEFLPFIGPFLAGAAIVMVGLLQSPAQALAGLIFVIALQQLEGNLIAPQVMHPQTNMSPLATVVVIFAGWSVAGVLGAIVAIPLYAGFRVIMIHLIFPAVRRQTGAGSADLDENVT